ncbi:hypothetical protein GGR52DRAFT_178303 [Hypoxylon sp. FL1284]|nr:hypothetical protein GGR52DRAFT_178303 [Hypoxylon sp. FL1284]
MATERLDDCGVRQRSKILPHMKCLTSHKSGLAPRRKNWTPMSTGLEEQTGLAGTRGLQGHWGARGSSLATVREARLARLARFVENLRDQIVTETRPRWIETSCRYIGMTVSQRACEKQNLPAGRQYVIISNNRRPGPMRLASPATYHLSDPVPQPIRDTHTNGRIAGEAGEAGERSGQTGRRRAAAAVRHKGTRRYESYTAS